MVGGLVQQEDVGVLQNEPGQVDPGLFPAGEGGEGLLPHGLGDVQAIADLIQFRGGVVAAPGLKGGGELAVLPQQVRAAVLPHFGGQAGHLGLHGVEGSECGVQHVLHRVLRRVDRDLGDEAQGLPRGHHHLPLVMVQLTGEDLEHRGLAGAVLAQQTHPLPLVHLKREPVQYFLAYLELLDQVRDRYVYHCLTPFALPRRDSRRIRCLS